MEDSKKKFKIVLVWALRKSGTIDLLAVDTDTEVLRYHVGVLRHQHDVIRVWTEKREANHLYAHSMGSSMVSGMIPSIPAEAEALRKLSDRPGDS